MFLLAMLACHGPDVRNEAIEMRDGAGLATDVYLPRGDGPFPVVLTRTPYGRWMGRLLSRDLEQQGYALVAQDTRGRGASEGVDCVFRCEGDGELQDGFDTLSWIDAQPCGRRKRCATPPTCRCSSRAATRRPNPRSLCRRCRSASR